jgi:microcystin-dependent protein
MAFWKWSRTASSNATADSTINWAEGMAPSAVNDSARAMMARLAEWRDDVSGTIATAGTSTAYTVASNQGFDNFADMNGAMIAFVPHTTNGATVTLNVDGLGGKPLRFGPSLELQSGVLIQGTPYVVSYNNSDGAFYLQGGFADPYGVPIGAMLDYTGFAAPSSAFVLPAGQAISRTTYSRLFTIYSALSLPYGAGDGSTTFNVPDLRGRVVAAIDNLNGSAAGRIGSVVTDSGTIQGTVMGSAGGSSTHLQAGGEVGIHGHTVTDTHTHSTQVQADNGVTRVNTGATQDVLNRSAGSKETSTADAGSIVINNSSANSAMAWLQPTIMLGKILRVI